VGVLGACQLESLVELAVVLRNRVNVMQCVVGAGQLERLTDLDAEDVRHVPAALLIQNDRRGRHRKRAVSKTVFHVHENVLQRRTGAHHHRFRHRRGILLFAVRV
jgi:hypothetical protein